MIVHDVCIFIVLGSCWQVCFTKFMLIIASYYRRKHCLKITVGGYDDKLMGDKLPSLCVHRPLWKTNQIATNLIRKLMFTYIFNNKFDFKHNYIITALNMSQCQQCLGSYWGKNWFKTGH